MNLVTQKDKALHKKAKTVSDFKDLKLKRLAEKMKESIKENQGIGLAAPQVGKSLAMFVIDKDLIEELEQKIERESGKMKTKIRKLFRESIPDVFINPEIKELSSQGILMEEGCLSVPRIFGIVPRSEKITVEARDINGKKFKLKAEGLLARVIQHEIDHLNGRLFVEKAIEGTLHKLKVKK